MLTTEETTPTPTADLTREHAVKFFVEDADLYETLTSYVRRVVGAGHAMLVVATPEHRKGLTSLLSADGPLGRGLRLDQLVERGQLVFVDAFDARDELMVKGQPSGERFQSLFGSLIEQMQEAWPGVQVYDEMTDLLAEDSQFGPMRQLEQMWDGCRRDHGIGLLSGYRIVNFSDPADEQPFENVCRARQQVFAAGETGGAEVAKWQRRTVALNDRLEQKREELAQTRKELERQRERHHRQGDFMGKFAHELRNPLAPLLCAVEMMSLRGDTTTERERGIIERQVSRMVGLVDDFVGATHVMFDHTKLQKSRVELQEVVREATGLAQSAVEDGEHRLHVDIARTGLSLDADPDYLAQALAEMIENAAIYTPEGGNIWVEAKREAGSVAISVRDDGPGIDQEILDDVFEMFVQGEIDAPVKGRGMGLGLALVQKIAQGHDGAVAAYSEKGTGEKATSNTAAGNAGAGEATGSEFVMRLPLARRQGHSPGVSRLRRDEVMAGGKVLVVDDNKDFATMLSETLDLLGHDVRLAHNADEALAMLEDFWPDVALLDINLPGMTGHQLAERIKAQAGARVESRLVAVTGYSDERKRKRSEEMGFDAHLVKPIVLSQLQETLDLVLED